jgi:hypothetical protein
VTVVLGARQKVLANRQPNKSSRNNDEKGRLRKTLLIIVNKQNKSETNLLIDIIDNISTVANHSI